METWKQRVLKGIRSPLCINTYHTIDVTGTTISLKQGLDSLAFYHFAFLCVYQHTTTNTHNT